MKKRWTPEEVENFFREYDLHIGDGVDNCAGEDHEEMRNAAEELARRINDDTSD